MLDFYIKRQKEIFEEFLVSNRNNFNQVEEIKFNDIKKEEKLEEKKVEEESSTQKPQEKTSPKYIEGKNSEFKKFFQIIEEEKTLKLMEPTNGKKNLDYFEGVVRKSLLEKLLENGIKREIEKNSREKIYWSITELNECLLKTFFRVISSEENRNRFLKENYNPLLSLYGVSGDSVHKLIQENLSQYFGEKLFAEYTVIEEKYKIKGRLDLLIRDTIDLIIELKTTGNKNLSGPYLSHYNQCQIQMFCMREAENSKVDAAILWYLPIDKYFLIEYDEIYINDLKSKILKLTELHERFKQWKEERQKRTNILISGLKKGVDEEFIAYNNKELRFIKDERFCKFCEFKEWCYRFNIIKEKTSSANYIRIT